MRRKDNGSGPEDISPVEFALLAMVIGLIASGFIEGLGYREPAPAAGSGNPTFVEMHAYDGAHDDARALPERQPR